MRCEVWRRTDGAEDAVARLRGPALLVAVDGV